MSALPLNPGVIAMAGDWHGNLGWAEQTIDRAYNAGASVIVPVGDLGFWVPDPGTRKYLRRVEQRLSDCGMRLLFVDGNHEDHPRLNALPIEPATGLRPVSDHIHHLPRGHRWTWNDKGGMSATWMALGGAVSVDRQWRAAGKSWWPGEVLSDDDVRRARIGGLVDVLVSHDAPAGVAVPGLDGSSPSWPADAARDADAHRETVLSVVEAVRPRQLWHGHYHVRYDDRLHVGAMEARPDWDGTCAVHGLDGDESHWRDNLVLVNADGTPRAWSDA